MSQSVSDALSRDNFSLHFGEESTLSQFLVDSKGVTRDDSLQSIPESLGIGTLSAAGLKSSNYNANIFYCRGDGFSGATPLHLRKDDLERWCTQANFPPTVLNACFFAAYNVFEYDIEEDDKGANFVSVALRWYLNSQRSLTTFARFDLQNKTVDMLVASFGVFDDADAMDRVLRDFISLIQKDPLLLLPKFVGYIQLSGAFSGMSVLINNTEMDLGVTEDVEWLKNQGSEATGRKFDDINASMVTMQRSIANSRCGYSAIIDFSDNLTKMAEAIDLGDAFSRKRTRQVRKECQDVIRRAQFELHEVDYLQKRLDSLASVLYHRMLQQDARLTYEIAKASKQDSSAMKTISILTLTYLPGTFISSIFSTTVFNFQNWGGPSPVASGGWWAFVVSCILLTIVTFVIWYMWTREEEKKWAEKNEAGVETGRSTSPRPPASISESQKQAARVKTDETLGAERPFGSRRRPRSWRGWSPLRKGRSGDIERQDEDDKDDGGNKENRGCDA